jgi:tripartite-type tricarboxylate transporter receptor subunit TctC
MIRLSRRAVLGTLISAPLAAPALATPWKPDRPVELVVGFAPGGGTDIVARLFARFLEQRLGQPITVINRPGASSEIALTYVARSRPDGQVLGLTNMPSFVTVPLERRAQYTLDSFGFVGNIMTDPTGIVVKADGPIKDVPDLINKALAAPDEITVSTSGIGTDDHLMISIISSLTGARFTVVHFNGAPIQRTNLMGGQVQVNTMSIGEVMPDPRGLRYIAHGGAERSRFAPETPTFKSLGLDFEMYSERGLVVPRNTPDRILGRLRDAVQEAASDPATARAFEAQFIEPTLERGEAWEARMRSAQTQYAELWRKAPWINT